MAVAKAAPPTLGTVAVWGMPLTDAAQLALTVVTLFWWLWLIAEKAHDKLTRRKRRRRRRDDQ